MSKEKKDEAGKMSVMYYLLNRYIRPNFMRVFYKKVHYLNLENIPQNGQPLLVVSNHQNALIDALGILFSFKDRKVNFITRADAFLIHPLIGKFFKWIGLWPSFRLSYEGEAQLGKNAEMFHQTEQFLVDGNTLVMFPEAGHQTKHWLGTFSFGYTRLAFEAAELGNFEKDIMILPSANHYTNYFGVRNEMMVKYGTPISLQPYYELYKVKPRTAQREVNKLVRAQIESLMLDIRDLEHYQELDFLRNTYNRSSQLTLPEQLTQDKAFVATLEQENEKESEKMQALYEQTKQVEAQEKALQVPDRLLERPISKLTNALKSVTAVLLFPLWVVSLWPAAVCYFFPKRFSDKMEDNMFEGTFMFAVSVLIIVPLSAILTVLLLGFLVNWGVAILWFLALPWLLIFAWEYAQEVKKTWAAIRMTQKKNQPALQALRQTRADLWKQLDEIIKTK